MAKPIDIINACLQLDEAKDKLNARIIPDQYHKDLDVALECIRIMRELITPKDLRKEEEK